jgi:hypothetical protein
MIEVSEDGVLGNRRLIPVQRARHLTNVLRSGPKVPFWEVDAFRNAVLLTYPAQWTRSRQVGK